MVAIVGGISVEWNFVLVARSVMIVVDEVSALRAFVLFVVVMLLWRILCISLSQGYLYSDRVVAHMV